MPIPFTFYEDGTHSQYWHENNILYRSFFDVGFVYVGPTRIYQRVLNKSEIDALVTEFSEQRIIADDHDKAWHESMFGTSAVTLNADFDLEEEQENAL